MSKNEQNIVELLEYLEEIITSAPKVPITGKSVVDKREILDIIDQITNFLPEQLKKAEWVITEKERILGDVQKEYENVRKETMELMKQHVENHDLVKEAKIRANDIIALAQRDAKAIRMGSKEYATELLSSIDREIEEKKEILIQNMQKCFELTAKDIHENLSATSETVKTNISELREM